MMHPSHAGEIRQHIELPAASYCALHTKLSNSPFVQLCQCVYFCDAGSFHLSSAGQDLGFAASPDMTWRLLLHYEADCRHLAC